MKVFLLLRDLDYEGFRILSIWSSLEEAERAATSYNDRWNLSIEEWEIGITRSEGEYSTLWPIYHEVEKS